MNESHFDSSCSWSSSSKLLVAPTARRRCIYGSVFLLVLGGTLVWTCHFLQYRSIQTHLQIFFAGFPGNMRERLTSAASVPLVDSFIEFLAAGVSLICLGIAGMLWEFHRTPYVLNLGLHTFGILLQLPQFIIVHSSPLRAFTATIIGLSIGLVGIVLLALSLFITPRTLCSPPLPLPTRRQVSLLLLVSKFLYICGNLSATVSLILIGSTNSRIGLNLLISSYPMLCLGTLLGFLYSKNIVF